MKDPLDAAQQGILDEDSIGSIDLKNFDQWPQMIEGLSGFSHLWLIFVFHQHPQSQWKPKVWPPRSKYKVGVLASRSPYRPNPIGLSAVELLKIEGSRITVKSHDLLDGTPILDIKPYIAYADSFPSATQSWLNDCEHYKLNWSTLALKQVEFLKTQNVNLKTIIQQQLSFTPTEKKKKRVRALNHEQTLWILSIRTWRVLWQLDKSNFSVRIDQLNSGYSAEDLSNSEDPYEDKEFHKRFIKNFAEPD
jgi:tRNA-Thr(GGU) m(6)t(6)A37 methyltransferase TsaA